MLFSDIRKNIEIAMIYIINGPNLNLLGTREPAVYGTQSFDDYLQRLHTAFPGVEICYRQSNIEGEIVNFIQEAGQRASGIVINAAAYSHTSVAIADALKAVALPSIEVHISNIYARESFRHHSHLSSVVTGVICGLGLDVYRLAVLHLLNNHNQ